MTNTDTTTSAPVEERRNPREDRIAELNEAHARLRNEMAQRGGVLPLDATEELRSVELALRTEQQMHAAEQAGHTGPPKPGDRFVVTTAGREIKFRSRAGLRFEHRIRRPVDVIDASDAMVARKQKVGAAVVNPEGMLAIMSDEGLMATLANGTEDPAADRAELEVMRAENEALAQRNKELEAQIAKARRNAAPSDDGKPARLAAAAAEREKQGKAGDKPAGGDFGEGGKPQ